MKETKPEIELSLAEKTLILWQKLEEIEDVYLKDFADGTNRDTIFYGNIEVSLNFLNYDNSRECGIGSMSIIRDQDPLGIVPNTLILKTLPTAPISPFGSTRIKSKEVKTRKDIIIRRTKTGILESVVRQDDIDPATHHFPGDKNYPFYKDSLVQPTKYYEEILDNSKKQPSVLYRKLDHQDIDEALTYLDAISGLLSYIERHR